MRTGSAFARLAFVRVAILAACAVVSNARGQEDPGPWVPPPGSVAGPSSLDHLADAPVAPPQASRPGSAPPRLLSPVDRGFDPGPPPTTAPFERHAPNTAPAAAYPASPSMPVARVAAAESFPAPRPEPQPSPILAREPAPSNGEFDPRAIARSGFEAPVAPEKPLDGEASAPSSAEPRPLPPRPEQGESLSPSAGPFPFAASFGSLAVVLGLFFVFVWFQKSRSKRGAGALPPEVVEPLGTIPFVSRQALHVVRFGSKILLVNVTAGGSETLAEIDDPREAERILVLCRRNRPDPLGRTFRELLGNSRDRAPAGREGVAGTDSRARGTAHA